jgi:hypothetical protein
MQFPNWLKIAWWGLLVVVLSSLMYSRASAFSMGTATGIDAVFFVVWLAVLLAPLYQEVDLFGVRLKQQISELKGEVAGLRNDIRNTIDVRAQVNPVFNMPAPPPDAQLPAIEERLRAMLPQVLQDMGIEQPPAVVEIAAPDDVSLLFAARYRIERELRRIWREFGQADDQRRPLPPYQIARVLAREGLLDERLARAVQDVYRVASPAIHGEPVTEAQVAFVRDVAPSVISTLEALQGEYT